MAGIDHDSIGEAIRGNNLGHDLKLAEHRIESVYNPINSVWRVFIVMYILSMYNMSPSRWLRSPFQETSSPTSYG